MESGSPSPGNYNVRLYARMLAALLCFIVVLFSFLFMSANSQASASRQRSDQSATFTLSTIKTSTATSTPTATPTATNTPTPTATSTPKPTPTATRHPERTPTATATMAATTPAATATVVQATSTTGTVTTSSSTGQTPTSVPTASATATITTTTTNYTDNGTARTGPPAGGFGITSFPFMSGALVFLGLVSVFLIGFLLLRQRLLLPQPVPVNLPPSGAQPWRRVRSGSLHNHMNIAGDSLQDSGPTLLLPPMALTGNQQGESSPATEKGTLALQSGPLPGNQQGESSLAAEKGTPALQSGPLPGNQQGESSPADERTELHDMPTSANTAFLAPHKASVPNIDGFTPIIDARSPEPITGEVKPVTRLGTRLVKLEEKR
jgi:hypothetical protein